MIMVLWYKEPLKYTTKGTINTSRFARPPAACDSDIFHYMTAYIHNMHAIEVLIVN